MNKTILIGRLASDPDLRHTPNAKAVVSFRLAVPNRFRGDDAADFFTVQAWGSLAEAVAQHKARGHRVAVDGHLTAQQWETDGGDKRSRVIVTADQIDFLDLPKANGTRTVPVPDDTADDEAVDYEDGESY